MSFVEENLLNRLLEDSNVSDIVGTNVFPIRLPERNELPAIAFIAEMKQRQHGLKSPHPDVVEADFVVNLSTLDRTDLLNLSDAVRICLNGSSGDDLWDSCRLTNEKQAFEFTSEKSPILIYHITQNYKIFYRERMEIVSLDFLATGGTETSGSALVEID